MKATITVKSEKDLEKIKNDLNTQGQGPVSRKVEVTKELGSSRAFEVEIEDDNELVAIKNDPRVESINSDRLLKAIKYKEDGSRALTPSTSSSPNANHNNWGLARHTQRNTSLAYNYTYQYDGTNVDIVIADSGITPNHPEFSGRLQQINWTAGQGPNHYSDQSGHGTHVASIAAGSYNGWALAGNIYSFKLALGAGYTDAYAINDYFLIKDWVLNKTEPNPTIVNNSWGTTLDYPYNHPNSGEEHPVRNTTVDGMIVDLANAGAVVVCSAGNNSFAVDSPNNVMSLYDVGYNYYYNGETMTYTTSAVGPNGPYGEMVYFMPLHRGQSPSNATNNVAGLQFDIAVAACDNSNARAGFSNYGAGTTIYAGGQYIQGAYTDPNANSITPLAHPQNSSYYIYKLSGTSMASPQVTGALACYMSKDINSWDKARGNTNQFDAKNWLTNMSATAMPITNDADNQKQLYTPWQDYTTTWNIGNGTSGTHDINAGSNISQGDTINYTLSAEFRNAASEQLHTVTYSVASGSIPTGTSLDTSTAVLDGTTTVPGTYTFNLSATNDYETETKDYAITIDASGNILKISDGITLSAGVSIDVN